MKLFGSSGIRGLANIEVTVDLALKVGMALGRSKKSAVIGRDSRVASEMIELAVISGLMSAGCDVVRVDLVTTPTLAYASRNYDCGVMITASHNPAEYVGIKLWNTDGMAFDSAQQEEIESMIEKEDFVYTPWDMVGKISSYGNAVRDHIDMIHSYSTGASLKVVLDCGGGAGGTITPYLLREMGCEVITLNSQLDGYFPARNPEPNDANLWMLKKAVKEFEADLGIAHDGDADRMMAVDETGVLLSGDEMLAIFALNERKGKDNFMVVVPVDTSMIVDDSLSGSNVIHTRVGDVYVAEEMKKQKADFGGEPSGSWIFPRISYCPDGIYAAALLVDVVREKRLATLREELPEYPTLRSTVKCENARKQEVMEKVRMKFQNMGKVSIIDGIRVDMEEGWVLVRPSGTEEKIRITAQARSNVEGLHARIKNIVMECLQ